ncbi:serine/threonine protein kinase [Geodermatophilus sabuli]|uniref:non-specific serine/threonine protein kinase n=1 Tax=Geodermatophilus sabuli TaxID=1564158 RepID=A0A285EHI2_9ACTN|nr:serine/threonine protein kinase [Geodermatophilus sabuli]MBB3086694.1 serine/threonine-protein kinase [Geodermatophilus sabuli]SNX97654.1 serine/threonine protein kinase [Geodermatophilus sabuli]
MHRPGTVLEDRYELLSPIAAGGMGRVWCARDLVLGRSVAVKVLRAEYTGDHVFLTRFRTEARLSAGLVHPNIAVLHDYGEVEPAQAGGDRLVYLVMELVDGEPLVELLQREHRLTPERTLAVLRQVAAGLAAAHAAGVVHRDVKPGNVIVGADGTVKITDFGIAWSAANAAVTRTGHVVGTPQYLAPEQVRGDKAVPASDVYSWGMVAYECLAGRRAVDGPDPVDVAFRQLRETPDPLPDDVPEPVRRLVEQTLVKEPADRIPDGAALLAAVDDVVTGRTPSTGRHAAPPDPAPAPAAAADPAPDADRADTLVMPAVRPEPTTRVLPAVPAAAAPAAAAPAAAAAAAAPDDAGVGTDADAGAPADDDGAGRSRRRLLLPLLVALVVVAAVAGAVFLGTRGEAPAPASATTPPPAAPTTSATPTPPPAPPVVRVRLAAAEYVGRPVGQVQAELTGLDLQVALRPIETSDVPDGQVIAVDPTGEVPVGTTIAVTHAVAPPPPPPVVVPTTEAPAPPDSGNGNGNGDDEDGERDRDRDRDRGDNGNRGRD